MEERSRDVKPLVPESGPAYEFQQNGKHGACRPSDVLGDDLLEYFRCHRWALYLTGGLGILLAVSVFLWILHHLRTM